MQKNNIKLGMLAALLCLASAPTSANPNAIAAKGNERWGANYFPNVILTTHDGKKVRFFDDLIKDKVVVINFIYTSCPDTCPLETARLLEVQRILGDRVGRDVFMYSISIDPTTDTPEVLKKYVELYEIGPGWTFLTGDEDDITLLRKKFGLYIEEIQNGSLDHNLNMVIGNQATGRWMKSSPFENPYYLARQIGGWLHNWKVPSAVKLDYADAPKLRNLTKGESLFRTRCTACHTIGGGDIMEPAKRKAGPDLLGVVQKRDRKWLARWMSEPEKMLQEGDPIAMELLAKYRNLRMPNMRLSKVETDRLIDYMDKEGRRVENVKRLEVLASSEGGEAKGCCARKKDEEKNKEENAALVVNAIEAPEPAVGSGKTVQQTAVAAEIPLQTEGIGEITVASNQRRGALIASMAIFGALGFSFLTVARRLRRVR